MRKIIVILIACFVHSVAFAKEPNFFDAVYFGKTFNVSESIIVSENSIIDVDRISINNALYFENRGHINGDFYVCDNCKFTIRNSGDISGNFYSGKNSDIIQMITNANDINRINVIDSSFSILVKNTESLNLSDILSISAGADKIILDNALLILGSDEPHVMRSNNEIPKIELVGEIILRVKNLRKLDNKIIMSNVTGDGVINITSPDLDRLYVARTYTEFGNLYLDVYRETDYAKIFDDHMGTFLNDLRIISPENPTINAIDTANTMKEIDNIISKSVTTNPINLLKPIKIFNHLEINDFTPGTTKPDSGFETVYVLSTSGSMYAGKLYLSKTFNKVDLTASAYLGTFDVSDKLNEFSGAMYGGNIRAKFDLKSYYVNSVVGFTASSFETDVVFDGTGMTTNPDGLSVYAVTDLGKRYNFDEKFSIHPFVGIVAEFDKVLHQSNTDIALRAGLSAGYTSEMEGIRNSYQFFIVGQTNNIVEIGVKINFWSISDKAGSGVGYSVIYDGDIASHKISADVKFKF